MRQPLRQLLPRSRRHRRPQSWGQDQRPVRQCRLETAGSVPKTPEAAIMAPQLALDRGNIGLNACILPNGRRVRISFRIFIHESALELKAGKPEAVVELR